MKRRKQYLKHRTIVISHPSLKATSLPHNTNHQSNPHRPQEKNNNSNNNSYRSQQVREVARAHFDWVVEQIVVVHVEHLER